MESISSSIICYVSNNNNCEALNQYGIDDIEDIEAYVKSHGGIDIQKTTEEAVNTAIKYLERYK